MKDLVFFFFFLRHSHFLTDKWFLLQRVFDKHHLKSEPTSGFVVVECYLKKKIQVQNSANVKIITHIQNVACYSFFMKATIINKYK